MPPMHSLPRLQRPTVSVVVCNFNYARYVGEAVGSALAQSLPCQVIVVDDGSTDGSRGVLAGLPSSVELLMQANGGQAAAYNAGFARCTGDVVIFLDADDALEPTAAERLAALFDEGVAKVHCRMALVDEAGQFLGRQVPSTLARGDVLPPLRRHGVLYPSAPGSGNAYRRSVLRRLFPLPVDPADRVGADFFTIYGAVAFGDVAACDDPLVRYRLHRPPQSADDALVFGNAALGNDEARRVATRYARLRDWVTQRSNGTVRYAPTFLDFSVLKGPYAESVFAKPYAAALRSGRAPLARLLSSVWLQREYGLAKRIGLSVWAVLVLLAPRGPALKLARYVCNPVSRAS